MKPIDYQPLFRTAIVVPESIAEKERAWGDIPDILGSMLREFKVVPMKALDMGVLFGYSTYALAMYFDEVVGIDTFGNNRYNYMDTGEDHYEEVKELLKVRDNVSLIKTTWQDYAEANKDAKYDLIHLDMIHTYRETFKAGDWALQHTNFAIFHDTVSNPTVMNACGDLADKYNCDFYNYEPSHGLGILIKK